MGHTVVVEGVWTPVELRFELRLNRVELRAKIGLYNRCLTQVTPYLSCVYINGYTYLDTDKPILG